MDFKKKTLEELEKKGSAANAKCALLGFDGSVDKIVEAVDKRTGRGDNIIAIETISEFSERISAAAGKSTNIELYPRMEKLGGNGPIMANALLSQGLQVKYIGALGSPLLHPVFERFAKDTGAVALCDPGITHAIEFRDGKIMLTVTASFDEITYRTIIEKVGEGGFFDAVSRADLIALVNWTMIPNMTAILISLLENVFPNLGPRAQGRFFFFDLADPEKRSDGDIHTALSTLARFRSHGRATLGLNLKEAQTVCRILGLPEREPDPEALKKMAIGIRQEFDFHCVVIHPTDSAACATREDAWWVAGPHTATPLVSTGAGDHFNAGFASAQLVGLSPPACLTVAVSVSGFYVRKGKSPTLFDTNNFIRNWN